MAIYDVFRMFNELDLLEIRMEILYPFVDYFVIGECNKTFQGNDKPFYYLENKDRFKKFEDKIIYNKFIDDMGDKWNHWDRDVNHMNNIIQALSNCKDDDIILFSDLDEIPNPEVLMELLKNDFEANKLFVFNVELYSYFIDAKVNQPWRGTRISNYNYLKKYSFDLFRSYGGDYWTNHKDEIINVTKEKYGKITGWHYSWLGDAKKAKQKLESFGHVEYNSDFYKNAMDSKINNLVDVISRPGWDPVRIKLDSNNCSPYLLSHLMKYDHLLCNDENKSSVRANQLISEPRMGANSNRNSPENNVKGLIDLIKYYKLENKNIVEIGCYLGISTEIFALFCEKVISIDLWGLDNNYDGGENPKDYWPTIEQKAKDRLARYPHVTLIKDFGENYNKNILDNSIDMVYIDANHSYEYVFKDLLIWYGKVKTGGILAGHDYNQEGVKKAVNEFFKEKNIHKIIVFKDTSWSVIK